MSIFRYLGPKLTSVQIQDFVIRKTYSKSPTEIFYYTVSDGQRTGRIRRVVTRIEFIMYVVEGNVNSYRLFSFISVDHPEEIYFT